MSSKIVFPALLAALAVGAFVVFSRDGDPAPQSGANGTTPAAADTDPSLAPRVAEPIDAGERPRTIDGIEMPDEFFAELGPNERIRFTMPTGFKHGIKCPDGSYLPVLNGVPEELVWPLGRSAEDGPLPPVIGLVTDRDGIRWYEHADGSATTTQWGPARLEDGTKTQVVVTRHFAAVDDARFLSPDGTPGDRDPSKDAGAIVR